MNLFANNPFMNMEFMNTPTFKQFTANQTLVADQIQKMFASSEASAQKAVKVFSEQFEMINSKTEKMSELTKTFEENSKKVQKFLEDAAKNSFDQKLIAEQMKQLEYGMESAYKAYAEQIEKNSQFFSENVMAKNFESSVEMMKSATESFAKYAEEQFSFFVNFQKELLAGMKDQESMKSVSTKLAKMSQEIMESNTKTVVSNVQAAIDAGNKVVAEGVKTAMEVSSKPVSAATKSTKKATA